MIRLKFVNFWDCSKLTQTMGHFWHFCLINPLEKVREMPIFLDFWKPCYFSKYLAPIFATFFASINTTMIIQSFSSLITPSYKWNLWTFESFQVDPKNGPFLTYFALLTPLEKFEKCPFFSTVASRSYFSKYLASFSFSFFGHKLTLAWL